ncbi:unnamed protein product [Arabidopsis thaliana]|uniref:Uncharacterized protein n=1 Tax=Arabidopsis thaliana TaxID=3702 RepID=A0A654EGE5_ARATH|nr:unnamed protein product [Arabidopsis thaliana]
MEKRSDSESVEILGDWDLTPPEERIVMVSVPTSPESDYARSNQPKEIESRVSDKESASASGEVAARRVLPPWMDPSYEWGGGKWKVFEVAPSLHVVELRKTGDDTLEFHKFYKNIWIGGCSLEY